MITDLLVFLGGLGAFGIGGLLARRDESLRGVWLLGLYVAVGYAVWGSLAQQRLYYLVPFLPAFGCALAAVLIRALPWSVAHTAVVALIFGAAPLVQAPLFSPEKLDPEPALADLGPKVVDALGEDDVVFRYNDFFAATELYLDRRAIGLTPSPEMLSDFGRILVLGERDIARDGRPGALFALYYGELEAGRPLHIVADARSLGLMMAGMPALKPRTDALGSDGASLWFASTDDALTPSPGGPGVDPAALPTALRWLADHRPDDLPATLEGVRAQFGADGLQHALTGAGLMAPPEGYEPPKESDDDSPDEPAEE